MKGGCTGPSESTFVKMPHCWKSHVAAHVYFYNGKISFLQWDPQFYLKDLVHGCHLPDVVMLTFVNKLTQLTHRIKALSYDDELKAI